jgi:methylmalonyl-CoA/ethylmalonyl-CoA epimerase
LASQSESHRSSHLVLDHIGILVADFDGALERFGQLFGGTFEVFDDDEPLDCRWARLPLACATPIEIVAPRSDRSPYARDLERRGEGVHHLSFRVTSIDDERDRLLAQNRTVVGFDRDHSGWQELFVHPRETHCTLLHFCVPPGAPGDGPASR